MADSARGLWSPRSASKLRPDTPAPLTPVQAAAIATEHAALGHAGACPRGIFVIPSEESLARWQGVMFLHRGPYAGAVLRFAIIFPPDFPRLAPGITFEGEVFHPLIGPKTKAWHPVGPMAQWQLGVHHLHHLLHDLKRSFKSAVLDGIAENQAANKQIWSLYHHSRHTFLAMTRQRALATCRSSALYGPDDPDILPQASNQAASGSTASGSMRSIQTPPRTPLRRPGAHTREMSGASSVGSVGSTGTAGTGAGSGLGSGPGAAPVDPGLIRFRRLEEGEREALWARAEAAVRVGRGERGEFRREVGVPEL